MPELLRVFLDANVLFSASYEPDHLFLQFWREPRVVCLTSFYAADETRRNCVSDEHRKRFEGLLEMTHLVSDAAGFPLASHFVLPPKDQPILAAALQAGADYLATGDKGHFGQWMNEPIPTRLGTLLIMRPRPLLQLLASRG
ncbi:MAG: PIN domain-containing protein [Acidobacteriaceae bacterium]